MSQHTNKMLVKSYQASLGFLIEYKSKEAGPEVIEDSAHLIQKMLYLFSDGVTWSGSFFRLYFVPTDYHHWVANVNQRHSPE